jgi:hypothetical protein
MLCAGRSETPDALSTPGLAHDLHLATPHITMNGDADD